MSSKMRNNVTSVFVAVCAMALLVFAAYGQELTVKVTRLAGPVQVRAMAQSEWADAKLGQVLQPGDALRTLKGGKVQLLFPQNTIVLIKENSVLSVKDLREGGGGKVKTLVGGFLFNLQEALSPGSTFEVETPSALAVVRGTKFGTDVGFDGTSRFTGYDGEFEVTAEGVTVTVGPGEQVDVEPGEAPSESTSHDEGWEDAADEAAVPEGISTDELTSAFGALNNRYRHLANRMQSFYDEFMRYEAQGDQSRMSFVYYNVQPTMEWTEDADERLALLLEQLAAWAESLPEDDEESRGPVDALAEACSAYSAQIHAQYDEIEDLMAEWVPDLDELLDELTGTIESDDPERDIRYGTIDTDNDGVPDVVEHVLTGGMSYDEPLIVLIYPDDGEEYYFPESESIFFEFEAVGEEYFDGFELHLAAGGLTMVRNFVGTSMDLPIVDIVEGSDSPFTDLFADGEFVEFTWFVRGQFNFDSFYEEHEEEYWEWGDDHYDNHYDNHYDDHYNGGWYSASGAGRGVSSIIEVDSESRVFSLYYPLGEMVEFELVVIGPSTVSVGESIRMRVEVGEVATLASWEIIVNYDPSLVEFDRGSKAGLTSGTTLFFGDSGHGQMTISGQAGQEGETISGSGAFAEIEFIALDVGLAMFDYGEINLYTPSGLRIEVIPGGSADVDILGEEF